MCDIVEGMNWKTNEQKRKPSLDKESTLLSSRLRSLQVTSASWDKAFPAWLTAFQRKGEDQLPRAFTYSAQDTCHRSRRTRWLKFNATLCQPTLSLSTLNQKRTRKHLEMIHIAAQDWQEGTFQRQWKVSVKTATGWDCRRKICIWWAGGGYLNKCYKIYMCMTVFSMAFFFPCDCWIF